METKQATGLSPEFRALFNAYLDNKQSAYLSDKQVAGRYSITRECVWKWAREMPGFPQPVRLSPGCTRWVESELDAYELARIAARDGEAA